MHDALKNLDKLLSDAERERDAALARVRELEGASDYDEAAYNLLYETLEGAERERDEAERERDAARKEGKDALLRAIAAERERDALKVRLEKVRAAFEGLDAPAMPEAAPIVGDDLGQEIVGLINSLGKRDDGGWHLNALAAEIDNASLVQISAEARALARAGTIEKRGSLYYPKGKAPGDDLDADQRAILAALSPEWQTVLQLHKSAVEHGFSKGNQTVRNYMLRGLASRDGIETQTTPLAWRLNGEDTQ